MTTADLKGIEHELGLKLPGKYRRFARLLPPIEEAGGSFEAAFGDAKKLISENRSLRLEGVDNIVLPTNFFCIGELEGDRQFIDLNDRRFAVYDVKHDEVFDPEKLEQYRAGSLDDLIQAASENAPPSPSKKWIKPLLSWLPRNQESLRTAWTFCHHGETGLRVRNWEIEGDGAEEQMIRELAAGKFYLLTLSFIPDDPFFGGCSVIRVVGESGRFHLALDHEHGWWQPFDADASPEQVSIVAGKPEHTYSGQHLSSDVELLVKAARHYVRHRTLLPSITWVRVNRD